MTIREVLDQARRLGADARKRLAVAMLGELELELFGDTGVEVKLARQILSGELTDDTADWVKAQAKAKGLT